MSSSMEAHMNRGYLHPFWNGGMGRYLYGVGELPRTLAELAMCQLSAQIRRSDDWWTKVQDYETRKLWLEYGLDTCFHVRTSSGISDTMLSRRQVQYVVDELCGYAALRDSKNMCQVSCFDRIWETYTAVDQEHLLAFNKALQSLRTPDTASPHKFSVTVDILDPYRHALVYGYTLARGLDNKLRHVPSPPFAQQNYTLSASFAFIPTVFSVAKERFPPSVSALSYINGVSPSHITLRTCIEACLATCIPLFEHVLTDLHRSNLLCHRIPGMCKYTSWDEPFTPEHSDDEEGWANYQREMREWVLDRPVQYPDVPDEGYTGGLEVKKYRANLRGRTLKVVVKVIDIHLRPDNPTYGGTPWHAEGMRNERIVACAVRCIAMTNISELTLAFRMPVRSPAGCTSDDEGATIRTWGLRVGAASHQFLGSASLREGHAIAFPNVYQHRLTETHLVDPAKEGTATLVSFFLVDPELSGSQDDASDFEILATNRIPPQRMDWTRQALEDTLDVRIPNEIIERIVEEVDGLMSEEEAREYAQEMKRERITFWKEHNLRWFSLPFNGFEA